MKVEEFAKRMGMKLLTGEDTLDKEVEGMYICDLLSWVMSKAKKGNAWITVHTHVNVVAVALLAEVSCIIIPENIEVEQATIERASKEGIAILSSEKTSFEIACEAGKIL
ncbi:DRTGG domain-containing protein [Acetivibrio saccincola]|jgi:predicted transcriptional regulator|uniref:AraC family transcriptional regulator n=1 Tax=Acetivibrio saccincola TaxID=1677857 RepID=A0A2K9DYB0_9FIRM|nr:DRTGG domain-containing protein [Acetivibrio saccincola]AUG56517.1 DRTGG domain protein [Acetivibrio saccincola]NLW28275.1 AraC family transcriptional regulator [Acetivibrio saccincola]PQQ66594.1 AraC family transcriptional regulator [Acetivibrio saccincola]HOA98237.1 DRTGG domain-containing protein [Acetivibrio saccincola]HQD29366.1 DRTGG domain-containing protein [Acetivibrio saccincola]